MICQHCKQEIPENQTVCTSCGTSALETAPQDTTNDSETEQSRSTYSAPPEKEENAQDPPALKLITPLRKSENTGQDGKTDEAARRDRPPVPLPGYHTPERNVYIPVGREYVRTNTDPSASRPIRPLPASSGIIYEVAEELYRREKTASELEAMCRPPFRKVFTEQQLARLNRQAADRTKMLLSQAAESQQPPLPPAPARTEKPPTTASTFVLQLLLMLPVINLVAALVYAFRPNATPHKKAYCRAFLIWMTLLLSAALVFLAFYCFVDPSNRTRLLEFLQLG